MGTRAVRGEAPWRHRSTPSNRTAEQRKGRSTRRVHKTLPPGGPQASHHLGRSEARVTKHFTYSSAKERRQDAYTCS